jgi:hypothetical protein
MRPITSASTAASHSVLPGHWQLPEPLLAFDPVDTAATHAHPLLGLDAYGPHSATSFGTFAEAVRVAMLAPSADLPRLRAQLNELTRTQQPRERPEYLPEWRGFTNVFRTALLPAAEPAQLSLPADLNARLSSSPAPHRTLAETLVTGLRQLTTVRTEFDVVVFYLPARYQSLFEVPTENFHLHDLVKAAAADLGLTTQIITDQALTYRCRASVAWRLATALYAKAGGTPWTLARSAADLRDDSAYIGLSYALRPTTVGTSFVTCCSQVFDADGGGMEFVAYDIGEGRDLHNQYLTREQMRLIMARSLAVYQRRHAGRSPARLIVHRQSSFRREEIAGCLDAWGGAVGELTCVSITRTPWRAVSLVPDRRNPHGSRAGYAVDRGTTLQLDDRSALVWVSGNARTATLSGRGNYLQGGKGTPRPLLLTRDTGRGPLTEIATQILALSKLNWNNDALHDNLPVTLRYAQTLARTIKHIPMLASRPYDYRLFM